MKVIPQFSDTAFGWNSRARSTAACPRRRVILEVIRSGGLDVSVAHGDGGDVYLRVADDAATSEPDFNQDGRITDFLETLYSMESQGQTRLAIDVAIDHIDDLLNDGNFIECRNTLMLAEPEKMSDGLIVSFLGITLAAKDGKIRHGRRSFYSQAIAAISTRRGQEGAIRLLSKYK